MSDEKYNLSMDEIKAIYEAGVKRGSDEATAFDWGCSASGRHYDELVDELFDVFNRYGEVKYDDGNYINYHIVEALVYEN